MGKRRVLGAVLVVLALPATASAAPTVDEYSSGLTANSGPMGIAAGPDGNVWFTENGADAVAHVHPDGTFSEYPGITGRAPRGIVTGPDGNVWFTESSTGTGAIGRITPSGTITEFRAGMTAGNPQYIAAGPDGNLWFTENGGSGAIGRITPAGVITEFTTGLTPNSSPWGITAGPDGNLWFTEKFNAGRIGRITPAGVITEFGGLPAGLPQEITAGPDGNLWFTAAASPGYIGRITPAGVVTSFSSGLTPSANPQGITAADDGSLYFTEKSLDGVGRITTDGQISEFTGLLTPNSAPFSIAGGPDGDLWFAENGNAGAIGRFSPLGSVPGTPPAAGSPSTSTSTPATTPVTSAMPTPVTTLPGATDATPVLGSTVVVSAATGTIGVRRPGEKAFHPVQGALTEPVGLEIDARRGTVVLSTALPTGMQRASFRGAIFRVRQSAKGAGMTDIVLTQRAAARTAGASAAATTRRKPPSLWAHDSHGRYRTFGHNSVATVRGTTWRTTELAGGTLTQVVSGSVSVRDLHSHRSVLVRAGHRYLARAKLRG